MKERHIRRKIRVTLFHNLNCVMSIHIKVQKQIAKAHEFVDSLTLASAFGI